MPVYESAVQAARRRCWIPKGTWSIYDVQAWLRDPTTSTTILHTIRTMIDNELARRARRRVEEIGDRT